jgi:transitional endoplasmic reticulum ATPase
LARQLAPCIIFFDQLDALAPVRGLNSGSRTTERVVNQLLRELDDLEHDGRIAVLAATNRIDLVDPSLLQPGRFGTNIAFRLPDQEERAEIMEIFLCAIAPARALEGDIKQELAEKTEGLTGAELRSLVEYMRRESSKQAERPLMLADLEIMVNSWLSAKGL